MLSNSTLPWGRNVLPEREKVVLVLQVVNVLAMVVPFMLQALLQEDPAANACYSREIKIPDSLP